MRLHDLKLTLLGLIVFFGGNSLGKIPEVTSEEIMDHIRFLSSDRLEGRRAGTRGGRRAAQYIRREFHSYRLEPMGRSPYTFKQPFEFISGVRTGRRNRMKIVGQGEEFALNPDRDFRPVGFSSSGKAKGEIVFVGYGIESDELNYHDYGGVDVSGKVAMMLRYSPDGTNPHGDFGQFAPLRYKAMLAREQGASAVIFFTGPEDDDNEDYLMGLKYDQSFANSGIPVMVVTQRWAKQLFRLAGRDVAAVQKGINEKRSPLSFEVPASVILETSVDKVPGATENVVGMVAGSDHDLANEYIIVGAHYDHLGFGGEGSLAPDTVAVHNGADDNASGTAGLLELAEWFSEHPQKRSLIFAAFGAEELGLLGSAALVDDPPVPLDRMMAMINMDMIGRLKDSILVVGGAGTSSIWKEMIEAKAPHFDVKPKFDDTGYGSSDHQTFYLKHVPVLFFFTGIHDDYHRPSDDWDKINADGEVRIVQLVRDIVTDLANRQAEPDFVEIEQEQPTRRGFAVYLGTIPDYTATDVEGMKLSGVRKGGPAEKGGLLAGDVIIKFGDRTVKNIYDFMYALQEAKADVPVTIVVRRGAESVSLQVVPGRRRD